MLTPSLLFTLGIKVIGLTAIAALLPFAGIALGTTTTQEEEEEPEGEGGAVIVTEENTTAATTTTPTGTIPGAEDADGDGKADSTTTMTTTTTTSSSKNATSLFYLGVLPPTITDLDNNSVVDSNDTNGT